MSSYKDFLTLPRNLSSLLKHEFGEPSHLGHLSPNTDIPAFIISSSFYSHQRLCHQCARPDDVIWGKSEVSEMRNKWEGKRIHI